MASTMEATSRSARLVEVIEVHAAKGDGTDKDPMRIITEYWSKDGKLLAVNDSYLDLDELMASTER